MRLRRVLESARRAKLKLDPRIGTYQLPTWPTPEQPSRIGIVGAGISGLVAAKLLTDLGFQVTVLEARKRPGGRMLSLALDRSRTGMNKVEVGAARICDQHQHTLYWLERYGLALAPFYPFQGRLVRLAADGRQVGRNVAGLSSQIVHQLVSGHLPWDSQFTQTLHSLVASAITKPTWFRVVGGVERLAEALAEELRDAVRYDAPVQRIAAEGRKLTILCQGAAEEPFDRMVLTAPLATYREIDFVPGLSEMRQRFVADCSSQPSLKVFVVCQTGWQTEDGLNGWGCTEDGMEIWCHTTCDDPLDVVTAYAQGECAKHLVAQDKTTREFELTELLGTAFPGMRPYIRSVDSYCWNDNRWSQGAQTVTRLAQRELTVLQQPEGALHFAGESTTEAGWINDAITSAYRVVGEICRWADGESGTTAGGRRKSW